MVNSVGPGSTINVIFSCRPIPNLVHYDSQQTQTITVQWACLAHTPFNILLAVVFWYVPVPEAPDVDLRMLAERRAADEARVGFKGYSVLY